VDTASCPWRPENRLVRIALKGEEIPFEERPASNLVFLLDVSGSMDKPNKLPLLKSCFKMMVDYLTENDRIAIVVYASNSRMLLPSTTGDQKAVIMEAIDRLQAGGSTNGAGGIQLAYRTAIENFIPGGLNRVILATDGDFNVGTTSQGELQRLIEEKAKSNVFLTTLGFGFGNLQDNTIELLADKGNGNYAYIDSLAEGRKVLIDEMGSTLNTIAKDVKLQIEFNPLQVAGYRLIGYENRLLAAQDFNDDTKDAGEIGAGHTVTAFYEIIPAGEGTEAQLVDREVDELEFQRPQKVTKLARKGDMLVVKLRYKEPTEDTSKLLKVFVKDSGNEFTAASRDFQFAASVASFGMLLRNSKYAGQANFKNVLEQAQATLGETPESYRAEFVELIKLADRLAGQVRN
jgi:Ca-activated chloride channel family protein